MTTFNSIPSEVGEALYNPQGTVRPTRGANAPQPETNAQQPATPSANQAEIDAVRQQAAEARVIAQMVADPNMRAVLEARQRGEKIRIVRGDEAAPTNQQQGVHNTPTEQSLNQQLNEPAEPDLDNLSPKDLSKYMIGQVLKSIKPMIEQALKPVQDRLGVVDQYVQKSAADGVNLQIEKVRSRYPDFDQYRQTMVHLSNDNPSLSVEELYIIAKTRSGQPLSAPTGLMSERPSTVAAKPQFRSNEPVQPGRAGFSALLERALSGRDIKLEE